MPSLVSADVEIPGGRLECDMECGDLECGDMEFGDMEFGDLDCWAVEGAARSLLLWTINCGLRELTV